MNHLTSDGLKYELDKSSAGISSKNNNRSTLVDVHWRSKRIKGRRGRIPLTKGKKNNMLEEDEEGSRMHF